MSFTEFMADPWGKSHPTYSDSVFNIYPAPAYASSEVVVASVYRAVGFEGHGEAQVPALGRSFEKSMRQGSSATKAGSAISVDTWLTVLHGALESPKLPNQSARRILQLSPIVPDVALYSGSARSSGNSWNPGALVQRMVQLGSATEGAANQVWKKLFDALTVGDLDDIWARWINAEFVKRRQAGLEWRHAPLPKQPDLPFEEKMSLTFPARQFVRDLDAIISAKNQMSRRQWISLLEAVLRLGSVTHVLWLCDVSDRIWQSMRDVIVGGDVPSESALKVRFFEGGGPLLVHGNPSLRIVRDNAQRYLAARLGINFLSWYLDPDGNSKNQLSSCAQVRDFLLRIERKSELIRTSSALENLNSLHEQHARTLSCKKGIGSNILEFCRHLLGQRQTANENLRGYDQGYFLRKKGQHTSAPWIVSLGPVAMLAMVHCCLAEVAGPRSVDRLSKHLARYRLSISPDDIADSDFGQKLRMLGLVLDSPDAESGMLLIPPFQSSQLTQRAPT